MHFNLLDETAYTRSGLSPDIAQAGLNQYLAQQAPSIALELPQPLVPVNIKVDRVGFTRNASNTPYIVYWVGDRRCCTFVKRSRFLGLVQALLKLKCGIEDKIRGVASSVDFGLSLKVGDSQHYIPSAYVRKFFERFNKLALERTVPVLCDCNDLFNMCLHQIAELFQPLLPCFFCQSA